MKDMVLNLMAAHHHCVISTVGPDGSPQSALVGFSENEELELLIGTFMASRKYRNISADPRISVVIADERSKIEIQYEGTAKLIAPKELASRLDAHFLKLPGAKKRLRDPNQVWIKISAVWVRYVDANYSPVKHEEVSFK